MQVVNKSDLKYVDGWVTDAKGNVVNNPELVYQHNEVMEYKDFNKFIKDNKDAIEAVDSKVVYKAPKPAQAIEVKAPKTPLLDEEASHALKIWDEQESIEDYEKINQLMERNDKLATFIKDDTILIDGSFTADKFTGDPLKLTEKQFVDIITEFVGNEKLRQKVIIER